jgi:hypothetical protein
MITFIGKLNESRCSPYLTRKSPFSHPTVMSPAPWFDSPGALHHLILRDIEQRARLSNWLIEILGERSIAIYPSGLRAATETGVIVYAPTKCRPCAPSDLGASTPERLAG